MFPGSAWLLCLLGLLIFFPCLIRNTGITHLEQTGDPESHKSSLQWAGHPKSCWLSWPHSSGTGWDIWGVPAMGTTAPSRSQVLGEENPCPHLTAREPPCWQLLAEKTASEGTVAGVQPWGSTITLGTQPRRWEKERPTKQCSQKAQPSRVSWPWQVELDALQ